MKFKVVNSFSLNGNSNVQLDKPIFDSFSKVRVNGQERKVLGFPMTPPDKFRLFFYIQGKVKKDDIIEIIK